MLKHYLKLAIRNFRSNRLIFAGSIVTIFLGALCIFLLFTYVHNELSMNDFHKRKKDIYLLTIQQSPESRVEVVEAERSFNFNYKNYPGIENLTTVKKYRKGELLFEYNETKLSPEGIVADSTFLKIFDFKMKTGDKNTILDAPDAIVLTEKFAHQLFGDENPLGKVIKVTSRRENIYTVKTLCKSAPPNSSITFDFIIPSHSRGYDRSGGNFILVNENFNKTAFAEKIRNIGHVHKQFKDSRMDVMPFDDVYFNGENANFKHLFSRFGNRKNIRILFVIIGVIFIITLLNFSNLQVININASIKNIGINKISGAGKTQIFYQKITELLLLILLSAVLISVAFTIALPYLNKIMETELLPKIWQIFIMNFAILTVLVAGAIIYPSFVFIRISVTNSLKSQIFAENKLTGRNIIATIQYSLSLVLLIASIVVTKQLNLMLNHDLGFISKNIISTELFHTPLLSGTDEEMQLKREAYLKNYQYVKEELTTHNSIEVFAQGASPVKISQMPWKLKGNEKDYSNANNLSATSEYMSLLGLEIVEGRFFENDRDEPGKSVVINEAAKKYFGIKNISDSRLLNKYWSIPQMGAGGGYKIVGVVKDFSYEHLSKKTQPLIILNSYYPHTNFLIRFEDGATQSGIQLVQKLFNEVNPGEPFEYTFLADDIEAMYQKEKRLSEIYILFTIIAYSISSLGLFAISLYDTRRRTKEIGIRKVNGAKISEILAMLNKDFAKWVIIAFIIAAPVAYFAMHQWLENFAYKTSLSWWIFALAGLLALGIALLTVSWQSWKAATRNPVEALRYE